MSAGGCFAEGAVFDEVADPPRERGWGPAVASVFCEPVVIDEIAVNNAVAVIDAVVVFDEIAVIAGPQLPD